jgi:hypothetical protein
MASPLLNHTLIDYRDLIEDVWVIRHLGYNVVLCSEYDGKSVDGLGFIRMYFQGLQAV